MRKGRASWREFAVAAACGLFLRSPSPAADCNRNGIEDHTDVTSGSVPDCDSNGIPDACDIAPVNFGLASRGNLFVEPGPLACAPADLDGDGDLDLAVAAAGNGTGGSVSVLWNSGTGSILATTKYPAPVEAPTLQAGDVDGDGKIDLAVAAAAKVGLLLNRGNRSFDTPSIDLPEDARAQSLALADLDADGDVDIACAALLEAIVLANDGDGGFPDADSIPIGSNPIDIAAAPIDGDDRLDLVTANRLAAPVPSGNISVLVNKGNGTFQPPRNFGVGADPASVAAGDLDGDGRTDVLTANESGSLSLLPGRGDGTFAEPRRLEATGAPAFALLADLDLDSDLDLVSARAEPGRGVLFLAFNHRGVFTRPIDFAIEHAPPRLSVQDLTGDGRADIAALEPATSSVRILEGSLVPYHTDCNRNGVPDGCELEDNDCNGNSLPDGCDIAAGTSRDCGPDGIPDECQPDCNQNGAPDPCDIDRGTSADCNRNGVPDECDVRSTGLSFESVATPYGGDLIQTLAAADLDADGLLDVHATRFSTGVSVLWNDGRGIRDPPVDVLTGIQTNGAAAGDLDGDGDLDLVTGDIPGTRVLTLIHDGNRSFTVRDRIPVGKAPTAVVAGDLDGDGDIDIAAIEAEAAVLRGILNGGDGTLAATEAIGEGIFGPHLLLADIDRDGRPDLLAADVLNGIPAVFWNEGGRFKDRTRLGDGALSGPLAVADLDGDGDLDLAGSLLDALVLSIQTGPRRFTTSSRLLGSPGFFGLVAADLDLDGDTDLATTVILGELDAGVGAFLNRGDATFDAPLLFGEKGIIPVMTSGDHDGDGAPDLVGSFFGACFDMGCELSTQIVFLRNATRHATSADANKNGRPDECEPVAFHRGDADGDGFVNLTDAVFTLRALFQGGPAPGCAESADADNDGTVNVTDPVSVLEHLFRGGPPPAPPGPPPAPCGLDPDPPGSPGDLGCEAYTSC